MDLRGSKSYRGGYRETVGYSEGERRLSGHKTAETHLLGEDYLDKGSAILPLGNLVNKRHPPLEGLRTRRF
jgi:hypothetical protein